MKAALVTTLRNADLVLKYFVQYHLSLGFSHIFLFFDAPDDQTFNIIPKSKLVTLIKNDEQLHKMWCKTRSFGFYKNFITKEVMARQVLNVEIALTLCLERKIDWLYHIDIDELFYSPDLTLGEHLRELTEKKITNIKYLNHEGIPEKMTIENYFQEVSLFKRNIHSLDTSQQQLVLETLGNINKYFFFHSDGKSATRVFKAASPAGVHAFQSQTPATVSSDPCILHFPCCGFNHFWSKYETLQSFGDKWFDQQDIEVLLPMHIQSRNIVTNGNVDKARNFYQQTFLTQQDKHRDLFLRHGIYNRITIKA